MQCGPKKHNISLYDIKKVYKIKKNNSSIPKIPLYEEKHQESI